MKTQKPLPQIVSLLIFLALSVFPLIAHALTIRVPADQASITDGIAAAADGDTVLVSDGTFNEDIDFDGKNITVASLLESDGNDAHIASTVIDGSVTFKNNENANAILRGFTITGSVVIGSETEFKSASPTLKNLIIAGNSTFMGGGLRCAFNSLPHMINVTIADNTANAGGAIFCTEQVTLNLENCIVWGNTSGGGTDIYLSNASKITITNSDVEGGVAGIGTDASSSVTAFTNSIDENPAFYSGYYAGNSNCDGMGAYGSLGMSISGTVTSSGGSALSGITVIAVSSQCGATVKSTTTDASGAYALSGLTAGNYYVGTSGASGYTDVWWTSGGSETACGSAEAISSTVANRNLVLTTTSGISISGKVTDSTTGNGVSGITVIATSSKCSGTGTTATTNTSGDYLFSGLSAGSYYVGTSSSYTDVWYSGSTTDCNSATAISSGSTGINLSLDTGSGGGQGSISGTITDIDGNPLTGFIVYAILYEAGVVDVCNYGSYNIHTSPSATSLNGSYTIDGLVSGETYYLLAENKYWWDSFYKGSVNCTYAESTLAISGDVSGRDFALDIGKGSISGTLYNRNDTDITSDDTPITGQSLSIMVVKSLEGHPPCGGVGVVKTVTTDPTDGTYLITDLDTGEYYLYASAGGNTYFDQWWADTSTEDCSQAQLTTVASGVYVTKRDFRLEASQTPLALGSVSGTVRDSAGNPITGSSITIWATTDNPCDGGFSAIHFAYTDSANGVYTIENLPSGIYYLRTSNSSESNFMDEWWADPASQFDSCDAWAIRVNPYSAALTDVDFQLDLGAKISGTVTKTDGSLITEGNIRIEVYASLQDDEPVETVSVIPDSADPEEGTYKTDILYPGTYYLFAKVWDSNYLDEWWDGKTDRANADSVSIYAGEYVTGKDFQLDAGVSISGTVYTDDGLTPVTGRTVSIIAVKVYGYIGNTAGPCSSDNKNNCWEMIKSANTSEADGTYTIDGLPPDSYYLYAWGLNEWWSSGGSHPESSQAEEIVVNPNAGLITGKDFQLDIEAPMKGDVNGDGNVDLTDVIHALQVLINFRPAGVSWAADLNGDNKIGIADAVYILQILAQLRLG